MNWEALGALAELLGALAVLITVIYLSVQIRQSSKAQEQRNQLTAAEIMQSRTDTVVSFVQLITTSERNLASTARHLAHAEGIDLSTLSREERLRIMYLATSARALFENLYEQHQKGFLSGDFYSGAAIKNILTWAELWFKLETPMSFEFEQEVRRLVAANAA